jgi:hypothetical protein
MRTSSCAGTLALIALAGAHAQSATVIALAIDQSSGGPLGFTAVTVLTQGTQRLTGESGLIVLRNLPSGEVRLRFRRIGYAPKDTAFSLAANDSVRIRIEMARLAIQLPATVVNGTCTDRTPFEGKPLALAELFDQVKQNAERMRLLAIERPFVLQSVSVGGFRDRDDNILGKAVVDTVERGPLPAKPYVPRGVIYRGVHAGKDAWLIMLPELPDLADTAFTNNHCFWYAGQERFGSDSVIRVDFEPVPWLAKEVDLEGSIYLRTDDYRLVGLDTKLNRIPPWNRALTAYTTRARFSEIVSGVPVVSQSELTNTFRNNRPPFVQRSRMTAVRWLDSTATKRDTIRSAPRRVSVLKAW